MDFCPPGSIGRDNLCKPCSSVFSGSSLCSEEGAIACLPNRVLYGTTCPYSCPSTTTQEGGVCKPCVYGDMARPYNQRYAQITGFDPNGGDIGSGGSGIIQSECVNYCQTTYGCRADFYGSAFATSGPRGCWCKGKTAFAQLADSTFRERWRNPARVINVRATCAELNQLVGTDLGCIDITKKPLESEQTCSCDQPFWYDCTAYPKMPHSKCVDGLTLDQGPRHLCTGYAAKMAGWLVWLSLLVVPFALAAFGAVYWQRRRSGKGRSRLPVPGEHDRSPCVDILLSIPWFFVGVAAVLVEKLRDIEVPFLSDRCGGVEAEGEAETTIVR
ncbi:hypothetical protein JCM8547_003817 [Rhodosporidiobolus lusitaniae]